MLFFCSVRIPIYVLSSLYRAIKVRFPLDIGGLSRDDRITIELSTGSLAHTVGIRTPKDFRTVIDSELEDDGGWLVVAAVAGKSFAFWLVVVIATILAVGAIPRLSEAVSSNGCLECSP